MILVGRSGLLLYRFLLAGQRLDDGAFGLVVEMGIVLGHDRRAVADNFRDDVQTDASIGAEANKGMAERMERV